MDEILISAILHSFYFFFNSVNVNFFHSVNFMADISHYDVVVAIQNKKVYPYKRTGRYCTILSKVTLSSPFAKFCIIYNATQEKNV